MDFRTILHKYLWVCVGVAAFVSAFGGAAFGLKGFIFGIGISLAAVATFAICCEPWIGVVLIAFVLPFERVASIDIGGFTLRLSQVMLGITLAVVIVYVIAGKLRIRLTGAHIPLLVFAIGASIALPASINGFRGVTSFAFMIFTALLVLLLPTVITHKQKLRVVLLALLFGAGVTAIFGLFQFAGDLAGLPPELTGLRDLYTKEVFGFPRIQSTALEPLYFANFLLLPIALAIVMLLRKQRSLLMPSLIVLVAALPAFVLTLSRAAYIALAIMLFFIAILCFRNIFSPTRIMILVMVLMFTFFAVNYALSLTGDKEGTSSAFFKQATGLFIGASYSDRVGTIQQSVALIERHPFGVGPGNFGPQVAVNPLVEPKGGWLIVNNIYLEVLAEEGIIGFIGFLAFIVVTIFFAGRAALTHEDSFVRSVAIACVVAIIAICVQYATFSILYIMHVWFAFGVALTVPQLVTHKKI